MRLRGEKRIAEGVRQIDLERLWDAAKLYATANEKEPEVATPPF